MVRVTPISIVYTILLLLAVFTLTMPAVRYYTNSTVARNLNDTYNNLNVSFTKNIYAPTYNASLNSSSGLKASNSLQIFTGLAFMFGAMFQVISAAINGIPMIETVFSSVAQYSPLPDVSIVGLFALLIGGAIFLLIWFAIASWTKVEA
ncbi:MAG: hypothetical protein QXS81_04260 [Candidatus Micrarchaeaceae archaeon]